MKKLLCAFLAMALVILPVGGSVMAYAEDAEAPENTVQVKKGLKKGKTYKVKVKVAAAKTSTYKKATKTVTLKIKIK